MKRKNKLVFGGLGIFLLLGVVGATTMSATTEFVSPTQLDEGGYEGEWVNLEGIVTDLDTSGKATTFTVTDNNTSVAVVYDDPLPETMQNGRIVVAKGKYVDGRLRAKQLSVRAHEGSERPDA